MGILLLDASKGPKTPVDPLIRVFSYSTCVIDDKICMLVLSHHIPDLLQDACELLTVPGVHLTTERNCRRCQRPSQLAALLLYYFPAFLYIVILPVRLRLRSLPANINLV